MSTLFETLTAEPVGISGKLEVVAPFNGQRLAQIETTNAEGVDHALAIAHGLYQNREGWLGAETRIAILERSAAILKERAEAFAVAAAEEGGKPLKDSRIEVARAIDGLKSCVEVLRTQQGHEIPMGLNRASAHRLAVTRHEPVGVVVAISAFNHPVNLIVHQIGPAIAAGCPVIIKPAEDTPLSCFRLVRILREAGLPLQWCQALVTDSHDSAERLATDPRVGFFSFIGSARVGWMLRSRLAPGTRCALEHGGAAPVIVAEDADLESALPALAKGGFYHAGQVCVSVQRVFAHRSIARHLAEKLAELAEHMAVGDPVLPDTDIGPMIRPRELERVHDWVSEAAEMGAKILCGGKAVSETCYAPTVLFDPPQDVTLSRREIFGPVLCVYPYEELDEAIAQANALPFAFQAAVFSRDIDTAMYCYQRLEASAVMVNDHTAFRVDWMPFAGLKQSGLGVGGIAYTFRDMQIEKMLVIQSKGLI
jgi:acyl-CoA reductase-like NAD-dependent aldehyde dehydrogenase